MHWKGSIHAPQRPTELKGSQRTHAVAEECKGDLEVRLKFASQKSRELRKLCNRFLTKAFISSGKLNPAQVNALGKLVFPGSKRRSSCSRVWKAKEPDTDVRTRFAGK